MTTKASQATRSQQIVLVSRPEGMPTSSNFKMGSTEIRPIEEGDFLVKNHWMSVDPYMRGRMKDTEGLENAPAAFMGLFEGDNLGKQLVHI